MTCIVAYKDNEKLYMGADGIAANTADYGIYTVKYPKVFKRSVQFVDERKNEGRYTNCDMLIGYTTSFRMGQILAYHLKIPDFVRDTYKDTMEYMVKSFIPALMDCFDRHYYGKKEDAEKMNGGTFLIGFNGNIFCIESNFAVLQSTDHFMACGCGKDHALGALYALELTNTDYDPENIVTEAILAASRFSGFVNDNVTILSTEIK